MHAQTVMVCPEKNQEGRPVHVSGGGVSLVRRMAHGLPLHACSLIADTRPPTLSIRARFSGGICRFVSAPPTLAFVSARSSASSLASAQASRTWVSGVGDDANPCSRTAPCKTFAGAISKTASGRRDFSAGSGRLRHRHDHEIDHDERRWRERQHPRLNEPGIASTSTTRRQRRRDAAQHQINGLPSLLRAYRDSIPGRQSARRGRRQSVRVPTGIQTELSGNTTSTGQRSRTTVVAIHALSNTIRVEDRVITTNNVGVQATAPGTVRCRTAASTTT